MMSKMTDVEELVDFVLYFSGEQMMLRNENLAIEEKEEIRSIPLYGTDHHVEAGTGLKVFPTLSPLAGYTGVEQLTAFCCRLEDLTALSEHPRLRVLEFGPEVELGNPAQLASLGNLEELRIAFASPLLPSVFEYLPNTVRLALQASGEGLARDRSRLASCPAQEIALSVLSLDLTLDSSFVDHLPDRIVDLQLSATGYESLGSLEGLARLRRLTLESPRNKKNDLSSLPALPKSLESLNVPRAQITNLAEIEGLTGLRRLNANGAKSLESIDGLGASPDLIDLRLRGTKVKDLGPLADLRSLRYLFAEKSRLRSLEGLESCRDLRQLMCHSTRVRSLAPLTGAKGLEWLDVAGCPIQDWSLLANFANLYLLDARSTSMEDLHLHPDLDRSDLVMRWSWGDKKDTTGAKEVEKRLKAASLAEGFRLTKDISGGWIRQATRGQGMRWIRGPAG